MLPRIDSHSVVELGLLATATVLGGVGIGLIWLGNHVRATAAGVALHAEGPPLH